MQHVIDEDSPLFGMTMDDLFTTDSWFVVTLQGTEASTMQTVFFSRLYTVAENVKGRKAYFFSADVLNFQREVHTLDRPVGLVRSYVRDWWKTMVGNLELFLCYGRRSAQCSRGRGKVPIC